MVTFFSPISDGLGGVYGENTFVCDDPQGMQWSTAVMSYDSCFRPILGIYRYGIIYDWIVFLSIYLWYQFVMVLPHDILTFDVSCIHNGVNDT